MFTFRLKLLYIALIFIATLIAFVIYTKNSVYSFSNDLEANRVFAVLEVFENVADNLNQKVIEGEIGQEDAINRFANYVTTTKYKNGTEHIFAYNKEGLMIGTGGKKHLIGKKIFDPQIESTHPAYVLYHQLYSDGLDRAQHYYQWSKTDADKPKPKVGFAMKYEPWGIVFGSGYFVDQLEARYNAWEKLIIIVSAFASFICMIVFLIANYKIVKPIEAITNILKKLSSGNVNVDIKSDRRDEIGEMMRAAHVFKDNITELRHLATHDTLTNLPNRRAFHAQLKRLIAEGEQEGKSFTIHMIDLDKFKEINDEYGHPAGDNVICQSAERLVKSIRNHDFAARLGGDEFAIIQQGIINDETSSSLTKRVIRALSQDITLQNYDIVRVGTSIGSATFPNDASNDRDLIAYADTALYHAKNNGRGIAFSYTPEMDENVKARKNMEESIDRALKNNEFCAYIQPRICLKTGEIMGYEALARWINPEQGMIPPNIFIPIAEETDRIILLGNLILEQAIQMATQDFPGKSISVNVSPIQFQDKGFVENLKAMLKESELSPNLLELEITENILIDNDERALSIINELKSIGVKIALDDFGKGYSSLAYLSRFPFDILKIDRSFIMDLDGNSNNRTIVETIIMLANSLNMQVVAEGIEDEKTMEFLIERNCHEAQGFFIGRPQPQEKMMHNASEDILEIIQKNSVKPFTQKAVS